MNDNLLKSGSHPDRGRAEFWTMLRLSVPMVVATSCRMVMDVTDFMMIAETGNTDALAAILPAQIIMFTYIVIGMGIGTLVNTLASQCHGRGDNRSASAYAWQSLYMSAGFWIVGAMLWPVLPHIFALAGHATSIQELECRYTAIAVWTIGPSIAANGLSCFFTGVHRPKITMLAALEGVAVNASVSFVLIFGHLGFPAMGIEGAAWGTVVGTNYRALRMTIAFCGRYYAEHFASRETWAFDWKKMKTLLRVGWPSGLQWCSDVTVWAIFTVVLIGGYFGKTHQLATNSVWQYMRITFLPCMGLGTAISSIVGKAIGVRDYAYAQRTARLGVLIMMAYMGTMSAIYLVFRRELIGYFCDDPAVVDIGATIMLCAVAFQLFDAVGATYNFALRAAGDTFAPSVMFVVGHWVIVVAGGFAMAEFAPQFGSLGPWLAASLLIIGSGIWLWWRWQGGKWMQIDIFKHEKTDSAQVVDDVEHPAEPAAELV